MGLFSNGGWFNNLTSAINPFDDKNGAFQGSSDQTHTGAHSASVPSPGIRTSLNNGTVNAQGQSTNQENFYNPMYDATKAANTYAPQLGQLASDSQATGQNAQGALNTVGLGAQNYGLQQGTDLTSLGSGLGSSLALQGGGIVAQGAGAQVRSVGQPNYALMNANIANATGQNFAMQNAALAQGQPNFGQANNQMANSRLDFGNANQQLNNANMNFGQANQALGQSQGLAGQLTNIEATPASSGAQAQLQSGLNQANANALALARSGRGWGGSAAALNQAQSQQMQQSQQAVNSAAMLKAQEEAAQRQRAAQNISSAAGIQQGAAGQYSTQQQAAANLGMQKSAQLASEQQAQANLGMQKAGLQSQQATTSAADQLARAQQYGNQAQFQSGQNMQAAGLELNQQQLNSQAALQEQQQNDALMTNLYGQGLGAELQGANLQMQGMQQGAQLGLSGYGQNLGALQAGGTLNLQGLGQAGTQLGSAYGMQANAIEQQQEFNNLLEANYAARTGQADALAGIAQQAHENTQNQTRGYISTAADVASGGATGAAGAGSGQGMSDRNEKKGIKPANDRLLVPEGTSELDEPDYSQPPQTNYDPFSQGVGISGPNQMQNGQASSQAAQAAAVQSPASLAPQSPTFGQGMRGVLGNFGQALQKNFGGYAMSDEREKEAVKTVRAAPGYSYQYKDPEAMGAAPGRQFGIMAQDLEKTPAGRSVVKPGPNGAKMVDTSRLTMVNTAALNGIQKQIDRLNALVKSKKAA